MKPNFIPAAAVGKCTYVILPYPCVMDTGHIVSAQYASQLSFRRLTNAECTAHYWHRCACELAAFGSVVLRRLAWVFQ